MSVQSDIDFNINQALRKLDVLTGKVERGFKEQERAVDKSGSKMERSSARSSKKMGGMWESLGARMKTAIIGAAASISIAVVTTMGKATQSAAKFRAEMAQVRTLTDQAGLGAGILDLAKRLPVALSDLTQGLYQAVSAGIDAGKAIQFMDVAARAAVGGAATTTEAVQGLTAALNGFQIDASKAEDVADTLFVGVKRGVTTFGQLAAQLGSVSGLAAEANVSLEETVAATAALTLTTNDTSRAVTQLRGIIQKLIKPTEQGQEALAAMGLTFDKNTIAEKGLRQALLDLFEASRRTGIGLGKIFEDVEGLSGALTLAGTQSDSFASILLDMETKAGAAGEAFRVMRDETTNLWGQLKQNLSVVLIDIGDRIIPSLNRALQETVDLLANMGATPLESALRAMQAMPGVDPEMIARLQVQVSQEQLMAERQRIQEFLDQNSTIGTGFQRTADSGFASAGAGGRSVAIAQVKATVTHEVNSMDLDQLKGLLDSLATEQKTLVESASGIRSPQDTRLYQQRLEAIRDEANLVDKIIRSRESLTQVEKNLADLQGALVEGKREESRVQDPPSVRKARSIAAEMDALQQRREELVDAGEYSQELVRVNQELAVLEAEKNELLKAGVQEWERQVERARQLRMIGEGGVAVLGTDNKSVPDFLRSRGRYNPLSLPTEDDLRKVKMDPKTLRDYERWASTISGSRENLEQMGRSMRNLATAGRSILRVADIFGELSSEVRRASEGILDMVDNFGAFQTARAATESSFMDKLIPGIGMITGAISAISGVIGMFGSNRDRKAEIEARERVIEAQKELENAMRENTRRVSDAINELTRTIRFGTDISGDQADEFIQRYTDIATMPFGSPDSAQAPEMFRELLRDMISAGIGGAQEILDQYNGGQMMEAMTALGAIIDRLRTPGSINTGTLGGGLEMIEFLRGFGAISNEEATNQVISLLSNLEGLPDSIAAQLAAIDDPTSQAGRESLRAIVAAVASMISTGVFDTGSATPAEVERLLQLLQDASEGGLTSAPGQSLSASVSRSITEVQAGLLTDLTRDVAYWTERGALAAEALLSVGRGHTTVQGQGGSALSIQNTFNGIDQQTRQQAHRALDDAIEEAIRLRERRLF